MKSTGKSRTVYVHEEDYSYLKEIGGIYAEGLRKAVEAHRERMERAQQALETQPERGVPV